MPRVSVIIPAHNAARYLGETLASVEHQTYDDWEIVLANDASTDETADVARSFGDRVTVLESRTNMGPAAARNLALTAASGELVALLDADDLWDPRYLEHQVGVYDDHQDRLGNVGVVACDARLLGPNGFLPGTYMSSVKVPSELTLAKLLVYNFLFVGAVAPRAVIEEAGEFTPEIFGTEDYDLWIRVLELGYRAVVTPEPLAVYRLDSASVSANLLGISRALQITYRNALERGRLGRSGRRIARRKLRLQRALEQVELIAAERKQGRVQAPVARLARTLPLFLGVALEHPHRWLYATRLLTSGTRRPGF